MEPQRSIVWPIVLSILGSAVVFGGGGYYFARTQNPNTVATPINSSQPIVSLQPTETPIPLPAVSSSPLPVTLLYTEVSNTILTSTRLYEVDNIYRKVGDAKPELLATVGKIGEFPVSFTLSPDKKTLLINLESKLQTLDLTSKTLTTVFTPKNQVFGVVYSPDGTRLFVWDQKDDSRNYSIHDFNLGSKKDTILTQGTVDQFAYYPLHWRKDNIVVIGVGKGEFSTMASYNIATKKLVTTSGDPALGTLSQTGMRMATTGETIEDICNDFSGSTSSSQKIIDPISAKEYATIGSGTKDLSIIAFSPDDKSVAYSEVPPTTTKSDCDKSQAKTYYQTSVDSTGTATQVDNINALLNSWGLGENVYTSSKDGKSYSIYEQGKITVSSDHYLRIISAF